MHLNPPSIREESVAVFRAAAAVFFGAWLVIGLHATPGPLDTTEIRPSDLLPFQQLFRDLPADQQREFRSISEGMLEAERVRASKSAWPEPAALATEGVPPFAPDPTDKAPLAWSRAQDGLIVNYRGVPKGPDAREWLVVVQEPQKGSIDPSAAQGVVDETHHLLPDGTLLHVTVWTRSPAKAERSLTDRPFAEGWTQVLAGK